MADYACKNAMCHLIGEHAKNCLDLHEQPAKPKPEPIACNFCGEPVAVVDREQPTCEAPSPQRAHEIRIEDRLRAALAERDHWRKRAEALEAQKPTWSGYAGSPAGKEEYALEAKHAMADAERELLEAAEDAELHLSNGTRLAGQQDFVIAKLRAAIANYRAAKGGA